MYNFKDVLTDEELEVLRQYNIPLQCEKTKEAVWDVAFRIIQEEISPVTERICDKLYDGMK